MKKVPFSHFVILVLVVAMAEFYFGYLFHSGKPQQLSVRNVPTETVYIRNTSPVYWRDKAIRKDIPAWEKAANRLFAPVWRTPHVKIVPLRRHQKVPLNGILATFKKTGPVSGALAFHGVHAGNPYIVVYTGVGDYYGYSNSESFTHELFETLADHFVSGFNIGYLTPFYYIGTSPHPMPQYAPWFNEVCDPVEKYGFRVDGVQISDFITPTWFNDPAGNYGYDYLDLVQFPFQVLKGGYAQYVLDGQDVLIENFRHAGRDADGFYKAERMERQ